MSLYNRENHARRPWWLPVETRLLESRYLQNEKKEQEDFEEDELPEEMEEDVVDDIIQPIFRSEYGELDGQPMYEEEYATPAPVTLAEVTEGNKLFTPEPEYAVTNSVNLREAVLVSLGGAAAALTLMLVVLAFMLARKRKRSASLVPLTPPVLVYPPHDVTASNCFFNGEGNLNVSLPALRSCSMGELRAEITSLGGGTSKMCGSGILSAPAPVQLRSNSFTNSYELGMLDPTLYKIDCLDEDLFYPEGHVGRVWFTVDYNVETESLQIHIIKAKHLPSRTPALANACDPYIRIQLVPDERRVLQTKQKKKTCNPFFEETFVFQVPSRTLDGLTLKMSVIDSGRSGAREKQLIGHILLQLSDIDASSPDEEPQLYKLDIEKEIQDPTSNKGELLVYLQYNENLNRLTITVVEARNLKLDPQSRSEIIVRVTQARACRGVRTRRTGTAQVFIDGAAHINECFQFRLRSDELHTTSVTLHVLQPTSNYTKDRVIGKFVMGSYMFARGKALQHWNAAISAPMEHIKEWHPITE